VTFDCAVPRRAQVDLDAYFNHQRQVEYYCYNQQFHRKPAQVRMCPQKDQVSIIDLSLYRSTDSLTALWMASIRFDDVRNAARQLLTEDGWIAQEGARHVVLDYFRSSSNSDSSGPSWQAQQHRNRLSVRPLS